MTGQIISHYRVQRELGRGGMGVVYEAEDLNLGRKVALKFLPEDIAANANTLERFRREGRILSSLNHPNICTIYEIGEFEGRHFIAMELMEGEPLRRCIAKELALLTSKPQRHRTSSGPLEAERIVEWAVQLADALDAAHTEGVVHRDLKPENIFIAKRGYAKILDFGLAKPVNQSALPESDQPTELTQLGAAVGTLSYMAPEQALGREIDARTDLFSLGVVLYEMATGKRPFTGASSGAVLDAILHHSPAASSSVNAEIPPRLDEIIAKCLEKRPELRYQSAAELCADLKRLRREGASQTGLSGTTTIVSGLKATKVPQRRTWVRAALASLAFLVLAGVAASLWVVRNQFSRAPEPVLRRLTSDSGLSIHPAISPDAKMFAYASDRSGEGNLDIWVRQVGGADPIRITHDPADDNEPDFSPDGTLLAFHSDRGRGGLYVVPVLGTSFG